MSAPPQARHWAIWVGVLVGVTIALIAMRSATDQTYVPLTYLLVVLGGSASGGRQLGFALAISSVLLIDYFLQTPYDHISITKPADLVTLAAYLVTAIVTSHLLHEAQRDRDAALKDAVEVKRLAAEHEQMARETEHVRALREGDRMKDFVLASVSHDLRTPLTAIKALAQDETRTGATHATEIEEQVDRLTRMVADLLDLSRLRAGKWAFTPELNSAEDVVGAAMRQCAALDGSARIVSRLDDSAPALYGTFDFVQTLRILVNLIENALRFTREGETVELTAHRDGAHLVFTVLDRGPGIAESERERVFDAFYRPEGSIADRGRAGIGLAIARTLAGAQRGFLTYHPREGGGSIFELKLPAADVDERDLEEA
ncbi:MAG TPA: ATP-binding protein [Gemmatimonadaceae bacterium]|nr:ATP-binding protein [Gemmatimonadaceae bacterium]